MTAFVHTPNGYRKTEQIYPSDYREEEAGRGRGRTGA